MATPAYMITLLEQGSYLGGVMLTDDHGIPLDFKYTVPVVPTKIQRIIYGSVLEQYIRNHVVIGALSKEISRSPSFFVVPQHQLYEIEEANNSLRVVSLQRTQLSQIGEPGTVTRGKENECLLQGTEKHPLRVLFGKIPAEQQEIVIKELVELTRHMDLIEPLERLEQALKSLCVEKKQG